MLKLKIIAVGKLKEPWWREAQAEFAKRLSPMAKLTVEEVEASPITASVSAAASMAEEGRWILQKMPRGAWIAALDRAGKRISSEKLAELLATEGGTGRELCLVIGGAAGLDPAVLDRADARISLSDLTFTHEMARIILLEQLYRAACISSGKKYHY